MSLRQYSKMQIQGLGKWVSFLLAHIRTLLGYWLKCSLPRANRTDPHSLSNKCGIGMKRMKGLGFFLALMKYQNLWLLLFISGLSLLKKIILTAKGGDHIIINTMQCPINNPPPSSFDNNASQNWESDIYEPWSFEPLIKLMLNIHMCTEPLHDILVMFNRQAAPLDSKYWCTDRRSK